MSQEGYTLQQRENAIINSLMAVLAILSETPTPDKVYADKDFRPGHTPSQCAYLIAASVTQTEVSIPIEFADRMIREVADGVAVRMSQFADEDTREEFVVVADERIHELATMVQGKGDLIRQIAEMLLARQTLTTAEVKALVRPA